MFGCWLRTTDSHIQVRGLVDIGNHMSIARLSSGRFLVIDAVDPKHMNGQLQEDIDRLTDGGRLIEAVVATHPFHTLGFLPFYRIYPDAAYIGTPRHLRTLPEIPWAGDISDSAVQQRWLPEVDIRIPQGVEFADPQPPSLNHFANAFVFHRESRTAHNDDCICYFSHPSLLLSAASGARHDQLSFHSSMNGPGLLPTPEAPEQFRRWLEQLLTDWDFDNLCTAHNGTCIGRGNERVRALLEAEIPTLDAIAERNWTKVQSSLPEGKEEAWPGLSNSCPDCG